MQVILNCRRQRDDNGKNKLITSVNWYSNLLSLPYSRRDNRSRRNDLFWRCKNEQGRRVGLPIGI